MAILRAVDQGSLWPLQKKRNSTTHQNTKQIDFATRTKRHHDTAPWATEHINNARLREKICPPIRAMAGLAPRSRTLRVTPRPPRAQQRADRPGAATAGVSRASLADDAREAGAGAAGGAGALLGAEAATPGDGGDKSGLAVGRRRARQASPCAPKSGPGSGRRRRRRNRRRKRRHSHCSFATRARLVVRVAPNSATTDSMCCGMPCRWMASAESCSEQRFCEAHRRSLWRNGGNRAATWHRLINARVGAAPGSPVSRLCGARAAMAP